MFNAIQFKYYIEKGIHGRWVNETQCMGCGSCVILQTCPTGALSMKLVDPPESLQGYHQQPLEDAAGPIKCWIIQIQHRSYSMKLMRFLTKK